MYDNTDWLKKHYFSRNLHEQLRQWANDHKSELSEKGIKIVNITFSDSSNSNLPIGEAVCCVQFDTPSLMASAEARERGFIDLQILDIESDNRVMFSHLEWQTTILPALLPFIQMLEDNL